MDRFAVVFLTAVFLTEVFLAGAFLTDGATRGGLGSGSGSTGVTVGVGTRGLARRIEATSNIAKTVINDDVTATSTTWEDVTPGSSVLSAASLDRIG